MAKRSRRERRAPAAKQTVRTQTPTPESPPAVTSEPAADFTQDYFYVYLDIRTLLIISIIMILVTIGLSFVL
jgi:hypothetical protein